MSRPFWASRRGAEKGFFEPQRTQRSAKKRFLDRIIRIYRINQNPVNLVNPVKRNLVCFAQRRRGAEKSFFEPQRTQRKQRLGLVREGRASARPFGAGERHQQHDTARTEARPPNQQQDAKETKVGVSRARFSV